MDPKEFLNPNSMLTPGIAGGTTMLISNSLWFQFGLPPQYSALALSFSLGVLVLVNMKTPVWQKGIYYLLNSLIIFSVGMGTNAIGAATVQQAAEEHARSEQISIASLFIADASADEGTLISRHGMDRADRQSPGLPKDLLSQQLPGGTPDKGEKKRRFFTPWFSP